MSGGDEKLGSEDASSDPSTSQRVRRALDGNRESIGWVVTRFSPLLQAQAAYRLGPSLRRVISPEDVVAEAWLVALRRLPDLGLEGGRFTPRLVAFLGTTILNIVNRRIDDHLRRPLSGLVSGGTGESGDPIDELQATVTSAVTNAARSELGATLDACLAELPPEDFQVIILRIVEGLTNVETARRLGEAPNTVSHRYQRALRKLRSAVPGSLFDEWAEE